MPKTIPPTVVYVDRDHLSLCSANHLEPISLTFSPEVIPDLEIINPDELHISLRRFIEQNKIKPGPIVLIVSKQVYFEKNYSGLTAPTEEDIENFIQTVPFSATSSKIFKVISGYKQVVLNRDFYEIFRSAFEELGFSVMAIVPGFALGQSAHAEFTADSCKAIYRKLDQIIADSIIGAGDPKTFHQQEEVILERNKPVVILIVIVVLLVCAAAVYFTLLKKPAPKRRPPVSTPVSTPSPLPVPTVIPIATPSAALLKSLSVRILNSSGISGAGSSLSAQLKLVGFSNIQVANSQPTGRSHTLQISRLVATTAAEFIFDFMDYRYPGITISTNSAAKYDLLINLAKTTP